MHNCARREREPKRKEKKKKWTTRDNRNVWFLFVSMFGGMVMSGGVVLSGHKLLTHYCSPVQSNLRRHVGPFSLVYLRFCKRDCHR
ncbi:hypothetical protein WH47_00132 [Habropoda laboriosa]|uniref:Uncharacterized protein n=1 Tax=Habropoda laboriosa TaxID=597456 RepID=A0A0L7R8Q5_9HYME|nr:hypothetical protein WH47_00132 [Habropoda laboriosa]